MNKRTKAILLLEDGRVFNGFSFGHIGETTGEVCFNTGMSGYQEILTDPSYCKQIVTMTAPHIGNYGINPEDIESEQIQVSGFAIKEETTIPSNWRSTQSIGELGTLQSSTTQSLNASSSFSLAIFKSGFGFSSSEIIL